MGKCCICGEVAAGISGNLGVCLNCIRKRPERALQITRQVHDRSRSTFGLPGEPPSDPRGLRCGICANDCRIGSGESGFCGIVWNRDGRLIRYGGTVEKGILEWYHDDLPTNCVSWWFCPGCTGSGYPKYSYGPRPEYGHANLAVFYGACSYDCLFCQNWHFRHLSIRHAPVLSAEALAAKADEHVSCICYFGGDPSPQLPHSLEVSRMASEKARAEKRILRICWETNGLMNPQSVDRIAEYALESGGNIKFDLKTWSEELSIALCGVSNRPAFANFRTIAERFYGRRQELPVLSASTLLVPGYVDPEEVEGIARFIGGINPEIPYTLLAFYPCHVMSDLPKTSRHQALECQSAAQKYLRNTRVGNLHLLS